MGPGVSSVVHAGGITVSRVQVAHPPCREDGAGHHGDQQGQVGPSPEKGQHSNQVERGEDVELLLDRERPDVAERRVVEVLEVGGVGEDLVPVGAVGEGREDRTGPAGYLAGRDHQHQVQGQHSQGQEQGGQEAPGPASRIGLQVDPPCGLELVQGDGNDQEAGQGEEQVNA